VEEKLIKTLLEQYRQRGIDLYAVIDDPLFVELPLEKKVTLLKQFASHISSGTSRVLTKKDIRSVIIDAGVSGAISGVLATSGILAGNAFYHHGRIPVASAVAAVGVGMGVTALTTLMNSRRIYSHRKAMGDSLEQLSQNPTDENAIRTLHLRNQQVRPNASLVVPSVVGGIANSYIRDMPVKVIEKIAPFITAQTIVKNEANPPVPWKNEIVDSDQAADDMIGRIQHATQATAWTKLLNRRN
jgi:hypothetical protein